MRKESPKKRGLSPLCAETPDNLLLRGLWSCFWVTRLGPGSRRGYCVIGDLCVPVLPR